MNSTTSKYAIVEAVTALIPDEICVQTVNFT